jgi:hypothetical protein
MGGGGGYQSLALNPHLRTAYALHLAEEISHPQHRFESRLGRTSFVRN